jgi:PKD repeat protein
VSGPDATPTFSAPTAISTSATVDYYGDYVFSITESNGSCSSTKTVNIRYAETPTANAGADAEINATLTYTLTAVPYSYSIAPNENWGTHVWTLRSSSTGGVISSWGSGINDPTPAITVSKYGDYVLRWTETNGTCSDYDEVTLRFVEGANAGPDQDLCSVLSTTLAGNTPSTGIGTWTKISGSGTVTFLDGSNNPATRISVTAFDAYVLQWTFSVGTAPANQDQVTIDFNEMPTTNAGINYEVCYSSSIALSGLIGGGASNGTWSIISGGSGTIGASITTGANVTATYTPDPSDAGKTITFRLTTDDPAGACPAVWDEVDVKINPLPVTSVISGPALLCQGATNKVYSVVNTPGSTYSWSVPAGMTITSPAGLYFIIVDAPGLTLPGDKITVTETLTSSTGCVGLPVELPVTVSPIIPGTPGVSGPDEVCVGDAGKVYSVAFNAGSSYSWTVPAGATITSPLGTNTITVTFTMPTLPGFPGAVQAIETSSAGCVTIHDPQTVTVHDLPVMYNVTAPSSYCAGGSGVTVTLSNSQTGFNYQLMKDGATEGAPVPGNDGSPLTWLNMTAGSYTVIATNPVTTCTRAMSGTAIVMVNTIFAGSIGDAQTICENSSPVPFTSLTDGTGSGSVTYQWQNSPDNSSWTNISGATSAVYAPGALIQDTYYRRIAYSTISSNTCLANSASVLITVNNLNPGSISDNQTICEGDIPAALTSVSPTTETGAIVSYKWFRSTDGLTYTVMPGESNETLTPGALLTDTWFKREVTVILSGNSCTEETNAIKITVNNFSEGSISSDQTICSGSAPVAFTSVGAAGDGVFSYKWQNRTSSTAYTDIPGATSATYTSPVLTEDTWFKRVVTSTLNGVSCVKETNEILVTVINFVPGSIAAAQEICEGDTPGAFTSVASSGDGTFIYQWQNSIDNVTYSNIPGATNETFASPALLQDTWFRRRVTSSLSGTSCTTNTAPVLVTVNNFTPGAINGTQTICDGDTPLGLTASAPSGDGTFGFKWQSSADGTTFTDITGATGTTYTPGALSADTWYRRLVTSTLGSNSCTKESNVIKITVNNFTAGSIGTAQTICEGSAPSALTSVTPSGDGSFTYMWFSSPDDASYTIIPAAVSETYAPGTLTADTWYRRDVTSTLNGKACTLEGIAVKITVNNLDPGSITGNQVICDGVVPSAFGSTAATGDGTITYKWQESPDGIAFTDIPGALSELYGSPALTQDTWFRRVATSDLGGQLCTEESNIIKVTVINFLPGSIGSEQTICEGTAPASFTSVAASGDGIKSYRWQSRTASTAYADIAGATSATYTSGVLTEDTWFRRVVSATVSGVSCIQYTNEVLVTVNNFDPGSIGNAQTICEGDVPTSLTSSTDATGDGTLTYQWQSSSDGTSFINITAATSSTYAPGALTQDIWFRRQAISTLSGVQCSEYTAPVLITVNNFTPGAIAGTQTICDGDTPSGLTATAPSGDGTFGFKWQSSADGTTFTDITGATGTTYTPGALSADTWYRRLVTSTLGSNSCTKESNVIKITVNNFTAGSIGTAQTICEGSAPSALTSVTPSGDGSFTYKWFSSPDDASYTVIPAAVSETYAPGALTADTWYRRDVTSTLNAKACTLEGTAVKITVNNFIPGSIGGSQTICENGTPVALTSVAPSGDGVTYSYKWLASTDGIVFNYISGETSETFAPGPLTTDTWYKREVTSSLSGNTCTKETNIVKVTVINFTAGSISADQTICEGTTPATFNSVAPSGDGSFTYQWQSSPDGSIFTDIASAGAATYTSVALTTDTWFRRMVISTVSGTSCQIPTNNVKVTINTLTPGTISSAQTICEGDIPAVLTSSASSGGGVISYQWQNSNDGIIFSNIIGEVTDSYNPPALLQDTWYRMTVTSTLNGTGCTEFSNVIRISVNNLTAGSISAGQTICEGDIPAPFTSIAATGDGVITYQWESSPDNLTWSTVTGAGSVTYTSGSLSADTYFRRAATSTFNLVPCTEYSNTILVTVINFDQGSISSDQTICEGGIPAPLSGSAPSGDGTYTYQWETSIDNVTFTSVPGATGESYVPSALTSDTYFRRKVTATLNLKQCSKFTNTVKITVINFIPGTIGDNQTICEGDVPSAFSVTAPAGEGIFTYQWKNSTDGVNFLDIPGASSDIYVPVALNQDTWYKRVVTSTSGSASCVKETNVIRITVNNVTAGTIISDQTICKGSDPVPFWSVVHGSGDGIVTYQWQISNDGITFTDLPSADAAVYDPPVLISDTWYRRITKSMLGMVECTRASNIVKVTVNVVTGGTIAGTQSVCFGDTPISFTSPDDGSATGSASYQWMRSDNNIIFSTIPGATNTDFSPGAHFVDTYYKRTIISIQNGVLCTAESNTIKVTVNPLPIAILSGGGTICPGGASNLKVELTSGSGPYTLNIENHGTVTGYLSNTDIPVTPLTTTVYRLLSVKDSKGCEILSPHANLIGSATVTVRALPVITTPPGTRTVCEFNTTTFNVSATGSDLTYQWYVNKGSGFEALTDGGVYFGSSGSTLSIFGATRDMNGYVYNVTVSGCSTSITSSDATLVVNTAPEIETQPVESTVCLGGSTSFSVTAKGTSLIYQWQVNKGAGFVDVIHDTDITGEISNTLSLTNVPASFNNYVYRVKINGACGSSTYSNFVILKVNLPPVVTINPVSKAVCESSGTVYFTASGSGLIDSIRWQVNTTGIWSDIYDNAVYSGTRTQQLSFINPPYALNGLRYRLALKASCGTVYTNEATLTVNQNPAVSFVPSAINACGGIASSMTPVISGGSGTWSQHSWSGDVAPLNNYMVQNPQFKTLIPAVYNLTYTVRDNKGCTGTGSIAVTVDSPDATFVQDVPSGCTPAIVNFTKDMTGISSWTWDFGDGSPVNTTTASPSHEFTNTTPSSILYRTVTLTVRSAGGCTSTKTSVVTVYPAINASFTANKTVICSGDMISFTGLSGANTYTWDFGDGTISPGTNVTSHLYTNTTENPVVNTVRLSTSSFYGCTDSRMIDITVMPVPQPQFSASPTPQIFNAAGNVVNFNNETNAGTWTYSWNFGDGGASTTKNPSHTYTTTGTFNVVLEVTNGTCTESVIHQVIITPVPPEADFEPIPSGCEPLIMNIHNTSRNVDVPGTTYRWDFGDGSTSTAKNPVYTFSDPGIYRVELTVTGPGGTSIKSQIVNAYPTPRANFDVAPKFVFVNDEKVRGFNLSTGADYFVWEWGDGDTSKTREPYHKYMESGVYDISLSAYKDNGNGNVCFDKYTLSPGVTVEPAGEIRFSTVFRPNLDGPIEMDHLPTGGDEIDQFFFPPIREKVIDYKLQIFNRLGTLIYESHNINLPWNGYYKGQLCPQGVYVWYVEGKYANGQPYKKVGDITLLH